MVLRPDYRAARPRNCSLFATLPKRRATQALSRVQARISSTPLSSRKGRARRPFSSRIDEVESFCAERKKAGQCPAFGLRIGKILT
jgi:hypothetical protein